MDIKEIKKEIRSEISERLMEKGNVTRDFIKQTVYRVFDAAKEDKKYLAIDEHHKKDIVESLCDDFLGFGPLQKLMDDADITEIMVNGPYKIYIEKDGRKICSDIKFDDEEHLRYIIEKMISPTARRIDESSPFVDFAMSDGSRINVIIPPLAVGGAVVTIRKFLSSIQKVEDLVKLGTIDERMAQFLVACIKAKINILFSGATGSGKTTTLEVLSRYINPEERIVTIEDALEINLRQDHVIRLLTKPTSIEGKGEITLRELFRNTLRMRPTRIILGEIRGAEAMDYLQALNSGHKGSLSIIHASSPTDAIGRLETMALYSGINLPTTVIRQQISSGLNLIVQHEQLSDGSRKITNITQLNGLRDNQVILEDIFVYEIEDIDSEGKVKGKWHATGCAPAFYHLFKKTGIPLSEEIFKAN